MACAPVSGACQNRFHRRKARLGQGAYVVSELAKGIHFPSTVRAGNQLYPRLDKLATLLEAHTVRLFRSGQSILLLLG